MKKIGFVLEVEGAKATVDELAKLELQLAALSKEIRAAKAAGDEDLYADLRAQQLQLQETSKGLRKEFRDQVRDFKEVQFPEDSIVGLRNRYRELKKELQTISTSDPKFDEQSREAAKLSDQINEANKSIGNYTSNIGRYEDAFASALDTAGSVFSGNISSLAAGFGAGGAIIAGLDALQQGVQIVRDLTQEFVVLRGEVNQLTGATGGDLDNISVRVAAVSDTFDQDYNEVLRAANALTKQLTGDFDQSLDLIEKGFLSGGNASGELLDSIKEYPAFFKEAGLSGEQLLSVITQSVQDGIFSDKGVDSIKEATIRLRELPKSTRDALNAIGFETEEIREIIGEKGIGGAIAAVGERLNELEDDSPAVGEALANIFGGAGEDSSLQFIRSLEGIDDAIDSNIDSSNQLVIQQRELLAVSKDFAIAQNELAKELGATDGSLETIGVRIKTVLLNVFLAVVVQVKELLSLLEPVGESFTRTFNSAKQLAEGLGIISDETSKATKSIDLLRKVGDLALLPFTALNKGILLASDLLGRFANQYNKFLDFIGKGPETTNTQSLEGINDNIELIAGNTNKATDSYSKYVSAATTGAKKVKEENDKVNDSLDDTKNKAEQLAQTSLLFLQREVQRLQTELTKAPSEDSGLIAGLKKQIEEAERKVIDARIALGQLAEPLAVPELQEIETIAPPDQLQQLEEQGISSELQEEQRIQNEINEVREQGAAINLAIAQDQAEQEQLLREQRLREEENLARQIERINQQAARDVGNLFQDVFEGEIESFRDFQREIILIALDALGRTLELYAVQAIGRELGTKGLAGAVTGAVVAGLIRASFEALKSGIANFAGGGVPTLSDGLISVPQNVPTQSSGDNVLAFVKTGEMILNDQQQAALKRLAGQNVFSKIKVPGFVDGGLVGASIDPQLVNPNTIVTQTTTVQDNQLSLSDDDIQRLAIAVAQATKAGTAAGTAQGIKEASIEDMNMKLLNNQLEN